MQKVGRKDFIPGFRLLAPEAENRFSKFVVRISVPPAYIFPSSHATYIICLGGK